MTDNKFLTTTKEAIILHREGGLTNPCLFIRLSLTNPQGALTSV